jgi:predicted DNA-binding transcriptional regulator YafY
LGALSRTTNLFPYPVDGWLGQLSKTYSNPSLKVLEGRIVYTSTPHPDRLKQDHFHTLVQSLVDQKRVDLTYRNRDGIDRRVDFEPLAFLNHNGVWYLMGDGVFAHRNEESNQPTQLKLSRLRLCTLSSRPFRRRFDHTETVRRLASTYGSHLILESETAPQSVTLRFFSEAARHVKESWFHEGQVVTDNPDGSCDLTVRVNDLFDALQLAGQWGALVRPLAPPELVRRWQVRAQELAEWALQRR